jgi:class 3 adenylate cyclase/tetratricopeptide (TPR) repeat protein
VLTCPSCGEENPARFRLCGFCGTPLAQELPEQEVRKTVTVVFSDLKGSTAMGERLDPESVRELMSRYFDVMREALERHGGRVEKYIGDAIMAVFGLPRVHEDDALRAVRAAFEMKAALEELNLELEERWGVTLENRTGVNTGEVVAGDPTVGQRLVTGDTVNTAARLEQAAPPLDVLIGEPTYRLVRHAVEAKPVEPLELKGKSERLPAFRLVAVEADTTAAERSEEALVGRGAELARLQEALERAAASRSPETLLVIGEAGVGKSRLLQELGEQVAGRAVFLSGRCLSYGRGITFWPVREIVGKAAGIERDDTPEAARAKLAAAAAGRADVVDRVAAAIGLPGPQFNLEELFFGVGKLLEELSAARPLVVVIEDVHWAESNLLELVDHLAHATSAAMLLVCTTRPDLIERAPAYADYPSLPLEPLSADDTARILESILGEGTLAPEVAARVFDAAEGNPLFAEQLLSMLVDGGRLRREHGVWLAHDDLSQLEVPPTINALLEARLDLLGREERATIESASVIGLVFAQAALESLVPEAVKPSLRSHLAALERRQLLRQENPSEATFRFQHILVRDAAYNGMLKRARATLHERFVDWADRVNRGSDRETEFEEILGYHLEQAFRYLADLGPVDEHGRGLARRGATKLRSAGGRAFERGDMPAAVNLLRRTAGLLPEDAHERLELLPDLSEALMEVGEFGQAEAVADEALTGAAALGDDRLEADAVLTRLLVQYHSTEDLEAWARAAQRETDAVVPGLEELGAHAQLAKAWRVVAGIHAPLCRWEDTAAAERRATDHARLAGLTRQEARTAAAYTIALAEGPTPVPEAIELCHEILARGLTDRQAEAQVRSSLASLLAMRGDFEQARALAREALEVNRELGARVRVALAFLAVARVELLAGEFEAAERALGPADEALESMGDRYFRPLVLALRAQTAYSRGELREAEELAARAQELVGADDVEPQAVWRQVLAKIRAAENPDDPEAELLARTAVELLAATDALLIRSEALVDYAEVLARSGEVERARAALEEALELCRIKQMPAPARSIAALRAALPAGQAERV